MSKALAMVCTLLTCPANVLMDMDWCLAWTPIDVLQIQPQFKPILTSLAMACDHHFWV